MTNAHRIGRCFKCLKPMTDRANFTYMEDRRYRVSCCNCGQYIEFNADSYTQALGICVTMLREQEKAMGKGGILMLMAENEALTQALRSGGSVCHMCKHYSCHSTDDAETCGACPDRKGNTNFEFDPEALR